VDLSIWGRFGRKAYRRNKFMNWVPDGEGGYQSHEIPGPENHDMWLIGWRVFSAACIMLRIISAAALEAYEARIEKLVRLWPDAWHLIATSDDQMRAEQLERIRRGIATAVRAGHPQPADWGPDNPWSSVFHAAASETTFWDEHITGPAQAWRSSGKRGQPTTVEELAIEPRGRPTNTPAQSHDSPGKRPRAPKWERDQNKALRHSSPGPSNKGKGKGKGKEQPNKGKSKDKSAQPCWSFSKSFGTCKDAAALSPCPDGRTHVCHKCHGPHPASACTQG
jgi:hypothetical protein